MHIKMIHSDIGEGYLTTENSASSYGQPVFVADDGTVYGTGDNFPRYNTNTGYLHQADGVVYTPEQIQWVHDYIVRTHIKGCCRSQREPRQGRWLVWLFGASWKTPEQLAEIEKKNNERMVRNA